MSKKSEITKQKVLSAAMEEFASAGYINGSTNTIAAAAGVSKGVIFHYFKNKMQLYVSCLDYSFEAFYAYIFGDVFVFTVTDLFERIYYVGNLKRRFFQENTSVAALIFESAGFPDKEEFNDIKLIIEKRMKEAFDKFYKGLDLSEFKPIYRNDETLGFIISVLTFYLSSIEKKYDNNIFNALDDYENIMADAKKLIDLLKYGALIENENLEI